MSIFDPYGSAQPGQHPGLNVGGATQVSTMSAIPTEGPPAGRYRSGALSALAPFLGYCSFVLGILMGFAALLGRTMCLEGRLDAAVCTTEPTQLVLAPIGVAFFGLVAAGIGGSLAKKRRAAGSLVALLIGFGLVWLGVQWFSNDLLGLPFP